MVALSLPLSDATALGQGGRQPPCVLPLSNQFSGDTTKGDASYDIWQQEVVALLSTWR